MKFFPILASIIILQSACLCKADPSSVKLIRTRNFVDQLKLDTSHATGARNRTLRAAVRTYVTTKGTAYLLHEFFNTAYVAELSIGNPSQTFHVVPDTGSGVLWVPDATCTSSVTENTCANPCKCKHVFNAASSQTYEDGGTVTELRYGTGKCSVRIGKDTVKIGTIEVEKQGFGAATSLDLFFRNKKFDGILGLGYPSLDRGVGEPLVINMWKQEKITRPLFALSMQRDGSPGKIGEPAGEITFGRIDKDRYTGDITYLDVVKKGYWQFSMEGFKVGEKYVYRKQYSAISDSGASVIVGPESDIRNILDRIGASRDEYLGLNTVDCSARQQLPCITFQFSNKNFPVCQEQYVVKVDKLCIVAFGSLSGSPVDWIFGDPFVRAWYQIYDLGNNKIGFATARDLPNGNGAAEKMRKLNTISTTALMTLMIYICHIF